MDLLEATKKHKRLGFSKLETAEIAECVNLAIASEVVFYHKLRAFHWNVQGKDFFDLHEKFEELYNQFQTNIDDLAERLRVLGLFPISNLTEMISKSEIQQNDNKISGEAMVREVISDLETIIGLQVEIVEQAQLNGDISTAQLAIDELKKIEKTHWMLTSWMNVHPNQ